MRTFHLLAVVCLCGLAASALALPPGRCDYVIVTTDDLAGEFARLAAFKSATGIPTTVVTLAWLAGQVQPGVDQPATIRRFLQAAAQEWGTQYALLGGDTAVVPSRVVRSTFYPFGGATDIPTDLYFGCLGDDWDGDGNGIWGEPYDSAANPGDGADLETDLAVGRAPVNDAAQAAIFVDKTIAYSRVAPAPCTDRALLMANVLFPTSWPDQPLQLDGASYGDLARASLQASPAGWTATRLYENHAAWPGSLTLNRATALAWLDGPGNRLVHHIAVCYVDTMEVGAEIIVGDDLAALTNGPDFHFFHAPYGWAGRFDDTCMIERSLRNPAGGCVGGLGGSRPMFPATTNDYSQAFLAQAVLPDVRVGDALRAALDAHLAGTERNTVDRWTHFCLALLADPTLTLASPEGDLTAAGEPAPAAAARLGLPRPNPFNPTTVVDYTLVGPQEVALTVRDLRGGPVRQLVAGRQEAGPHRAVWGGDDERGRPVPSGVYLLTFAAGPVTESRRLVLVR